MSREAYYLDRINRQTQHEMAFFKEATAEIERLRRENAKFRKVLHIAQKLVDSIQGNLIPRYLFRELYIALDKLAEEGNGD